MHKNLFIEKHEAVITLTDGIVYGQRLEFCNSLWKPMRLSLMRPRRFFTYDSQDDKLPVIFWICGGAFTEMNTNVWTPELSWFAKRGWAIVSIEYSVSSVTHFPTQIKEIRQAIRYTRANSQRFGIDPLRCAVMGESAGGYLSALTALSANREDYDTIEYRDESSAVQAAVALYPITCPSEMPVDPEKASLPLDIRSYPDLPSLVDNETPPFLLLHGDSDSIVPYAQSEKLNAALQSAGVCNDFLTINGADHADPVFYQCETKQLILEFLNQYV